MLKTSVLLGLIFMAVAFAACEKDAPYDRQTQLGIDDDIITEYLSDSSVTNMVKHPSGLYYNIIRSGTGDAISVEDTVYAKYSLKILKDSAMLSRSVDSTFKFQLPGYIEGWKTGVSLIRSGGEIRLIVPSPLGYQQRAIESPAIPPNSILDITLEILSVKNKKTK
jgi:FKBP-type peptidyl-prolyl cis-trans isomerase FkpA